MPFQAEPEEGLPIQAASSSSSKALFGPESEEAEDSPRTGASVRHTKRTGKFSFGWSKLHDASKARFNQQVAAIPKPPKNKRPYNNKSRAARAAFARKHGVLKQNGRSSQRISSVLALDECLCTCLEPSCQFFYLPGIRLTNCLLHFFLLHYYPRWPVRTSRWQRLGARKTCFSQYKAGEVRQFIAEFWDLEKVDQDSLESWPTKSRCLSHLIVCCGILAPLGPTKNK